MIEEMKRQRENLINKMETNYERGDSMALSDLNMFISIFENMQGKDTQEEADQVLLDHGWTLTRDDVVLHPDGTVTPQEPPDLHRRFINHLSELGYYNVSTGASGKPFNKLFIYVNSDVDISDMPKEFEKVPVEIKVI